jgi:hypothetical protein
MRQIFAISGLLLVMMSNAYSADYYTISVGQTKLNRNNGFGWWNQITSDQVFSEPSPSWRIAAGWNVSPMLDIEVGYKDLGKFSTAGTFVSDEAYGNITQGRCTYPCGSAIFNAYGEGKAYGFDVRAKIGHDLSFAYIPKARIYGAIGVFAYHTTYTVWTLPGWQTIGMVLHENENRVRPEYSVGIEYGNAFAEYTVNPSIGTEQSAFSKAQTLQIGVRF